MSLTFEDFRKTTDQNYERLSDIPRSLIQEVLAGHGADGVTLLKNGKEWAYEPMREYQPRTWKRLISGGDFKMFVLFGFSGPVIRVLQYVDDQIIGVHRQRFGFNSSDKTFPAKAYAGERARSLPLSIRQSYYHRIDGLSIPLSAGMGPFTKILPYPVARPWQSIDSYLGDLRLRKKLLPVIEEMIPGIRPEYKHQSYTNFMMFLNSWGSFTGEKGTDGDHLFIKNHIKDGVVYYIRDADVENMMIIADPAEAIDHYCEHVLLRREDRFDFRPWAVPFESPTLTSSAGH